VTVPEDRARSLSFAGHTLCRRVAMRDTRSVRGVRIGIALALLVALGLAAWVSLRDPDPLPEPARARAGGLPPLDAAIQALSAERWRLRGASVGPRPSSFVEVEGGVDLPVQGAIERLRPVAAADPLLAPLASALDRASNLPIFIDEGARATLRWEASTGELRVPGCATAWPRDVLATAVAHELVHEADHREIAAGLSISEETLAQLLTDLAGRPETRVHFVDLEERAFHVELRVARALGLRIPPPGEAPAPSAEPSADCRVQASDVLALLSRLAAAQGDPAAWAALMDRMFPPG